ncbi:MAG: spore photoproduct lyase family protein [Bacteriovorax sp.]|jgi:spore photoproduct lyase
MFEVIYVEKHLHNHPTVQNIKKRFPESEIKTIDKIEDVFGRVKKPYLQKRTNLNLFLGEKKGQLVKLAPPAYGLDGEPHYYFVHAYNCIYECNYCYLQGYFHSPDIVLYINHEEIAEEIKRTAAEFSTAHPDNQNKKIWFHAGEYSDSLALTHLSGELAHYFKLFKDLPHCNLELRTKSVNIKELMKENPLQNVITSFSLSPAHRAKLNDLKTPPLKNRLSAINELHQLGFPIGIHFDPIIYDHQFIESYEELCDQLLQNIPAESIRYISLGVVRFTKEVFQKVQKNYPDSDLLAQEFVRSFDNKIRYSRPMRLWMLAKIKQQLVDRGVPTDRIYLCMEDTDLDPMEKE